MPTTIFVDGVTKIQAAWLNSINDFVYDTFKGAVNASQARQAIHAVSSQGDNLQGNYVIDGDLTVSGDFEFGGISVNSEDVTYDGLVPENNVKDALDNLATTKENLGVAQGLLNDHVANPDPHTQYLVKSRSLADIANSATARTNLGLGGLSTGNNASDVPYDNTGSGLPAVDVQGAIDALIVSAEGVLSFNGRTGIVTPQAGDYNKTQIGLGNVENWLPSTQEAAETGTDNTSYVTPLRSRQGLEKWASNTLGTAATKDVITGAGGASTGSVVVQGSMGTGLHASVVLDFNELPTLYGYSGLVPLVSLPGSTNGPPSGENFHIFQYQYVSGSVVQQAIPYRANVEHQYIRTRYQGNWTPWYKYMTERDIVQTSGAGQAVVMSQNAVTQYVDSKVVEASKTVPVLDVTANRQATDNDVGKMLYIPESSSGDVQIVLTSSITTGVGSFILATTSSLTGRLDFQFQSGALIRSPEGTVPKTRDRFSTIGVVMVAPNLWHAFGDLDYAP